MKTPQLSVFIENRIGRLSEVTAALAEASINIRALSLADTSDFGILRMIVCDSKKAEDVLRAKGFTLSVNNVVAIAVPDQPGGLSNLLRIFKEEKINVEYMYAFPAEIGQTAVMIFRFDKTDVAIEALQRKNITLYSLEELCK